LIEGEPPDKNGSHSLQQEAIHQLKLQRPHHENLVPKNKSSVRGVDDMRPGDAEQSQRTVAEIRPLPDNEAAVQEIEARQGRQHRDIINNVMAIVAPSMRKIEHNVKAQ
jgi:hypothetical protein